MDLLRIKATDAEDMAVMSLCLQDAVVNAADISWRPGNPGAAAGRTGRFAFTTQRLCHEDKSGGLMRINCRFWVDGVMGVKHRTNVQDAGMLVLLAIVPSGSDTLLLHFADKKVVQVVAPGWHAYLEDFGVHWPAEKPPEHAI